MPGVTDAPTFTPDCAHAVGSCRLRAIATGWDIREVSGDGFLAVRHRPNRLSLVVSAAVEGDGRPWLHLSVSGFRRLPSWEELVATKEAVVGTAHTAVQVIPDRDHYINLNPYVLHLFLPIDGDPFLPDFTRGSGSL